MRDDTQDQGGLLEDAGAAAPAPNGHDAAQQSQPADAETKARSMGWVPQEEFKGDPSKWRPADEFVQRGEQVLPIVKSRLDKAEHKLQAMQQEIEAERQSWRETADRISRVHEVALKRQREQLEADFNRRIEEAASLGDVQAVRDLNAKRKETFDKLDEPDKEPEAKPQQKQPAQQPVNVGLRRAMDEWVSTNVWYTQDPELHHVANGVSARLKRDKPGLTYEQHLSQVTTEVRKRYPDKFMMTAIDGELADDDGGTFHAPAVASGRRVAPTGQRKRGARDLPSEARASGEKYVKEGLFKNLDEYAAEYWKQES